jgi:hypothetical protein
MIWCASFVGRKRNAIGIFYPITTEVEGETPEQAELNLYQRFDHISRLTLTPKESEAHGD